MKSLRVAVRFDNRPDEILRHIGVIGQQLLRILRQAVAAIPERWVVVMRADARVEAHAANDLAVFRPRAFSIGVELIEIGHTKRQIRVGEQLDRLGLSRAAHQFRNACGTIGVESIVFLWSRAFCKKHREGLAAFTASASSVGAPTTIREGWRLS